MIIACWVGSIGSAPSVAVCRLTCAIFAPRDAADMLLCSSEHIERLNIVETKKPRGIYVCRVSLNLSVNRWRQIALSNSKKAVNLSSACTTKRLPSSLWASATKIVRPSRATVATHPHVQPALLRLSAMISQYLTRCFVRLPLFAGQSQKWEHRHQKSVGQKIRNPR